MVKTENYKTQKTEYLTYSPCLVGWVAALFVRVRLKLNTELPTGPVGILPNETQPDSPVNYVRYVWYDRVSERLLATEICL